MWADVAYVVMLNLDGGWTQLSSAGVVEAGASGVGGDLGLRVVTVMLAAPEWWGTVVVSNVEYIDEAVEK